jgi:hypothetical protein
MSMCYRFLQRLPIRSRAKRRRESKERPFRVEQFNILQYLVTRCAQYPSVLTGKKLRCMFTVVVVTAKWRTGEYRYEC